MLVAVLVLNAGRVVTAQTAPLAKPEAATAPEENLTEIIDDALRRLSRERNRSALEHLAKKNYPAALSLLKEAAALAPDDAEIVNNLGHTYYLLGDLAAAERHVRRSLTLQPERTSALIGLADVLNQPNAAAPALKEAAGLLKQAREMRGNDSAIILRQARVAGRRGQADKALAYYEQYLQAEAPDDALRLELGDFHRDRGKIAQALNWYRRVSAKSVLGPKAAQRIFAIEVAEHARRLGVSAPTLEVPAAARTLHQRAVSALRGGRYLAARHLLKQVLSLAPHWGQAHVSRGDLLTHQYKREAAEGAYLRAVALNPANAAATLRLGRLCRQQGRNAEAAVYLRRVLQLQPEWHEARLLLAHALRGSGDLSSALMHVTRFLAKEVSEAQRREAETLRDELATTAAQSGSNRSVPHSADRQPAELSSKLLKQLNRAREFLTRNRPEAAMAALHQLPWAQRSKLVLNLEAQILKATGKLQPAERTLRRSLAIDPGQAEVRTQLGLLLAQRGQLNAAHQAMQRATTDGDITAQYHLARLLGGDRSSLLWDVAKIFRLWQARRAVSTYLKSEAAAFRDSARALKIELGRRLWRAGLTSITVAAVIALLVGTGLHRRYGGIDLATLVRRSPEVTPDVLATLGALHHEVLKHNTLALSGLLERFARDEGLDDAGRDLLTRLYRGENGLSVLSQLGGQLNRLRTLARSHGQRLNLSRKDRALAPIVLGYRQLKRLEKGLLRFTDRQCPPSPRILGKLRQAVDALNQRGYQRLLYLLERLRSFQVDEALIRRVVAEVATHGQKVKPRFVQPLECRALPCRLAITQQGFCEVLANLVRNALAANQHAKVEDSSVGISVERQVDPVTGLSQIAFSVWDHGRALDLARLRSQPAERGLGRVQQIISQHEGTLVVADSAHGFRKALVFSLPEAESNEEEQHG